MRILTLPDTPTVTLRERVDAERLVAEHRVMFSRKTELRNQENESISNVNLNNVNITMPCNKDNSVRSLISQQM